MAIGCGSSIVIAIGIVCELSLPCFVIVIGCGRSIVFVIGCGSSIVIAVGCGSSIVIVTGAAGPPHSSLSSS